MLDKTMLVHAGASLHAGHELKRETSPSKGNHHQQPRKRLLRSALRPLGDTSSSTTNNHDRHARFSLTLPSPEDFSSGRRSFTEPGLSSSGSVAASTSTSPSSLPPISPLALPSPSNLPSQRRYPASDIASKRDLAVRFREPTPTMAARASGAASITTLPSEDEESLVGSDVGSDYTTNSSTRKSRRKPSRKQADRYVFAHPAPQRKTKQRALIQFRPRMLLQVQRLEPRRPIPAFDILPSSTVSTSFLVPRVARHFPRLLRAKPELGPDDLVIVKSEDYKDGSPSKSGHGSLEDRDLMGVISPLTEFGDDAAEIVMADGAVWSTSRLPKGGYEFSCIDSHGIAQTARWAKKNLPASRKASDIPSSPASVPTSDRWVFSIVDPSSKRHPIMGTLDSEDLTVYDTYTSMSASAGRFPPTKPFSNRDSSSAPSTPTRSERSLNTTPEEYKRLMIVTASWISLRLNGWPSSANPTFRRNSMHCRTASSPSVAERRRTFPFANNSDLPSALSSPRPSFATTRVSDERPQARAPDHTLQLEIPKRHMSTGAAYIRRRRMETESLEEKKAMKENLRLGDEQVARIKGQPEGTEEDRTVTCRIKVRRLTRKLFHRNGHRKAAIAS